MGRTPFGQIIAPFNLDVNLYYLSVNWVWAYERQGLCHGHYFEDDFQSAKQELPQGEPPAAGGAVQVVQANDSPKDGRRPRIRR